jgi:hypothetical protein
MVLGSASGGRGLVSGTCRVLLERGGISWHERRAFVLVRWLSPFLGQGLPAGVGEECVRGRDHGFGALLRAAEDQVGDGPSLRG